MKPCSELELAGSARRRCVHRNDTRRDGRVGHPRAVQPATVSVPLERAHATPLTPRTRPTRRKAIAVEREIPVDIDLGLLAVFDPNAIDLESYQSVPAVPPELSGRRLTSQHSTDKERALLDHARDGIQLLVNDIWSQPTRVVDDGVIADLPPISTALPREKPVRPASLPFAPLISS